MADRELTEKLRRALAEAISQAGERGTVMIWVEHGRVAGFDVTRKTKYEAGEAA